MRLLLTGPLADKKDEQKSSYFLLYIGQSGRDIYNTWSLATETPVETLFTKFSEYCQPKKNTIMARFRFNSRIQKENETVDQFVTELRLIAKECDYGDIKDSLIRDRIIFGTRNEKIRERLLQDEDIKLDKALEIACSIEATSQQMSNMQNTPQINNVDIQAMTRGAHKYRPDGKQRNVGPPSHHTRPKTNHCLNCGGTPHHFSKCPARNKICNYCKKPNHFSKVCRKLKYNKSKSMNEVREDEELDEGLTFESIEIQTVNNSIKEKRDEVYANIQIYLPHYTTRNTSLRVKVDTGAQGNALPMRLYKEMFPENIDEAGNPTSLKPSHKILTGYGGHRIKQFGTCQIECTHKTIKHLATFFVTEDEGAAIMGYPQQKN